MSVRNKVNDIYRWLTPVAWLLAIIWIGNNAKCKHEGSPRDLHGQDSYFANDSVYYFHFTIDSVEGDFEPIERH